MTTDRKAKAVIFDMDGTLVDSERLLIECWRDTADKYGFDYDEFVSTLHRCIGLKSEDSLRLMKEKYGDSFDFRRYNDETMEIFLQRILDGYMAIKPGAFEILDFLKERGVPTALGTSTRSVRTIPRMRVAGMEKYFCAVVCGDMVEKSKPAPDVFLRVMEKLGLSPSEVFIVEDSNAGIEAAWRSGARVLMVPDILPPTESSKEHAEAIFDDLFGAIDYLRERI